MQSLKDKVLLRSRATITTQSFFSVAATDDTADPSDHPKTNDEIYVRMDELTAQSSGYEDAQVVSR